MQFILLFNALHATVIQFYSLIYFTFTFFWRIERVLAKCEVHPKWNQFAAIVIHSQGFEKYLAFNAESFQLKWQLKMIQEVKHVRQPDWVI